METQLKSLIEKYCQNSPLTDSQLDEIIDLALATKANPKEVEEYIQEKTEERKARIDAERKAKEEAERKAHEAKEEAERKAHEAKEEAERKAKEDAEVKAYKKAKRAEALLAYAHRNDSPEAAQYNKELWEEYDKIVKAVQSGRVRTMEDLKRELERESNRSPKTETISQQNDSANKQEVSEAKAKEEAERAEKERVAAIERAKREKEEAERRAKAEAERKAKEEAAKKAAAPSASISEVGIAKDVTRDGKLGIQVTAYIIINGMKGETAVVSVHNISELEQQALTFTKKPVTVLNEVYYDNLPVKYDSSGWKEYKFFVSYESLLNTEEELDKTLHIVIRNGNEWNANILAQYKILYHIKYVTHVFRANEWFFTLKN